MAEVKQRLTPTLFDKLVADVDLRGIGEDAEAPVLARERLQFYSVPRLDRFNEAALRATVRRELAWLLNTTNFSSTADLTPYPHVATSVLNYGVTDLAGKILLGRTILQRAREIRAAIRTFEPRLEGKSLTVEPTLVSESSHMVKFTIVGDITAAAQAMPVKFQTMVDPDTASVDVRE